MPNDLDDYEFQPPPGQDRELGSDSAPLPGPSRRGSRGPLLAAIAVVLLAAGGAYFFLVRRAPQAPPAPAPTPSPVPATAAPTTPPRAVPALDDSDTFVRDLAAGLSAHP